MIKTTSINKSIEPV